MVNANFDRALQLVLQHEGGWSDNPADPGGATMRGVTLATFRSYFGKDATKDDLRHITDAQLKAIYKRGYWDKAKCDSLASGVDYAVFDFAVNSGPGRARSHLLKAIGGNDATTIHRICQTRLAFLMTLKTWPTFGKGWTRRVDGVRREALRMAGAFGDAIPASKPQAAPVKPVVARKPIPGLIGIILAAIGAAVLAILKSKGVL